MVPNQYKDEFFKPLLQNLIDRRMADIVHVANKNVRVARR